MDLTFFTDNLISFSGKGFLFLLLLTGCLFLGLKLKSGANRTLLVWFPVFVMCIYFCPMWIIYKNLRDDVEILYRILWLIPMGLTVAYAMVEAVFMMPEKTRALSFLMAVLLIISGGTYIYSNSQFSKAENIYHIPDEIVKICDELEIDGREVRVCFPIEMVQYVRQYSPYICQPYGRGTLLLGSNYDDYSTMGAILDEDVVNTKDLAEELRRSDTPYFVVAKDTALTESITDYDFSLCFTVGDYLVYKDDYADLSIG